MGGRGLPWDVGCRVRSAGPRVFGVQTLVDSVGWYSVRFSEFLVKYPTPWLSPWTPDGATCKRLRTRQAVPGGDTPV